MRKTLALAALVALFALPAHAWTTIEPSRPFAGYGQPYIQTRPNIFGGYDIDQGFGQPKIQTRPNIFGGYDIDGGFGQPRIQCTPNIFGGVNCR
jgi:hypothetical protein